MTSTEIQQVTNKLLPREHLRAQLASGKRSDGRTYLAARHAVYEVGVFPKALGSASVRKGEGHYICEVSGTIIDTEGVLSSSSSSDMSEIKVTVAAPDIGNSTGLPSLARGRTGGNKPSQGGNLFGCSLGNWESDEKFSALDSICSVVAQDLQRVLSSPSLIDFQRLRISNSGRYSWRLNIDVICLGFDGNMFDGSLCAATMALLDLQLPALIWESSVKWFRTAKSINKNIENNNNNVEELILSSKISGRDLLVAIPVSVTSSFVDNQYWLVDPDWHEWQPTSSITLVSTCPTTVLKSLKTSKIKKGENLIESIYSSISDELRYDFIMAAFQADMFRSSELFETARQSCLSAVYTMFHALKPLLEPV